MKPEEALKILEEATGRLALVRSDHLLIGQALDTIRNIIKEK